MKIIIPSLIIAVFFAVLKLSAGFYFSPFWISAISILLIAGSLIKPYETICFFLLLIPLFGNRPSTEQAQILDFFVSAIILGSAKHVIKYRFENGIIQLLGLFSLVSFFSLTGLQAADLLREFSNYFAFNSLTGFIYTIERFFNLNEFNLFYSFKAAVYTAFAFQIGLILFIKARDGILPLTALLFASLHTVIFGVANYYGWLSLDWLRPLDPVVNPNGQFRLQSYFGHSGWLAEFLTLTAPFLMLILLLKSKFSLRLSAILVLMVLLEYTLILTYQRGGWLSYPLTVFVIWIAIYFFYQKQKNLDLDLLTLIKKSFYKIAISVPLTIIVSLIIINFVSSKSGMIDQYKDRLEQVVHAEDRLAFVRTGFKIGLLHPFMGAGAESFGYQYDKEVGSPTGRLFNYTVLALHGTAHNFYMQIFSGRGIAGIILLLSTYFLIFKGSLQQINNSDSRRQILILSTVCFVFALIIYGNVQEFFYVQILQICFFAVIANFAGQVKLPANRYFTYLIFSLFILHLGWEHLIPGNNSKFIQDSYGCHGLVDGARWCGRHVGFNAPIKDGKITLNIKGVREKQKLVVASKLGEQTFDLFTNTHHKIEYLVPADYSGNLDLKLKSDYYFVPKQRNSKSDDLRILSFEIKE